MKFYEDLNNKDLIIALNNQDNKTLEEKFNLLKENKIDASKEKHIPVCKIENDLLIVTVGQTLHPMDDNHYIKYIIQQTKDEINIVKLKPHTEPIATFKNKKNSKIYAYCNTHGLWVNENKE